MATWTCKRCSGEPVEIATQTLTDIRTTIKPNFRTLFSKFNDSWWRRCPRCNASAPGMEQNGGFPLRTRDGHMTDVHNIETEGIG